MAYLCEKCGEIFKGDAGRQYEMHIEKHRFDDTPVIDHEKYIVEYDILPAEFGDYTSIRLKNVETGNLYIDDAIMQLYNTNINTSVAEKLIGKRIRVVSYTEIIE